MNITSSHKGGKLLVLGGSDETLETHCDFEDMEGSPEDIDIVDDCSNHDDRTNKFDQIVGALEALVLTAEFEQLQDSFCRSHCHHFEATDENKLIYMEIFQNYTASVEEFLEKGLSQAVPGFDMGEFMSMLAERQDELAGEVFDMLLSLSDFSTFKDIMVSYKAETCSDVSSGGGFSLSLSVTPLSIVQRDEMMDGEERPELDFGISVVRPASMLRAPAQPRK